MKHLYLLYNPKSGRETIRNSISEIIELFTQNGYEVTARPTFQGGEATEIAASLPENSDIDLLVCCGGDGTLNETVTGIRRSGSTVNIGYIPCGSTNDFGNTIYGSDDKLNAAERIVNGRPHSLDCGKLADKTFVYAAAFGLLADISYETPHAAKAALGHMAYVLEALKNIGNIKAHKVTAVTDEGEIIEGNILVGMATNSDYVGGLQNIVGRDISLQDGLLELTLIVNPDKPDGLGKILQAINENTENEYVIHRKVKKVSFTFDEPVSFTTDGEYGGTYQSCEISCIPNAYQLVY